jgi:hypothetical protein
MHFYHVLFCCLCFYPYFQIEQFSNFDTELYNSIMQNSTIFRKFDNILANNP